MKKILWTILLCIPILGYSQTSVNYEAGTYAIASPDAGIMPHWLIYNRNGLFNGNTNEFLTYYGANVDHSMGKNWNIEAGIKGINKYPLSSSYLQDLHLNISYGNLKLIMGKQNLMFSEYSEQVGSGSFFTSKNARPLPRLAMGFYEYTDVPFTNGFVQVKGFLSQGILDDDRGPRGTYRPLLHEKAAYVRTNKLLFNPHFGILHSALFGGTMPNGVQIPADLKATFFAKSSKKVGDMFWGEETNVAGGHFGLFDFGLHFSASETDVQLYLQKPVNDKSGFAETFRRNKDFIFGATATSQSVSWLKEFVYERIYTVWQCGPGIPDPIINGVHYLIMPDNTNYDKILKDTYDIEVEGISKQDFWKIVRRKENYGYEYGGRDSYYNNGMYYKGLSYHGNAIGNSLLLTKDRVLQIHPDFDASYDLFFANTRVSAHHFGFLGNITKNMDYRLLFTYTNNYGTYAGLNKGHNNWDSMNPDSDYKYFFQHADFFVNGKNQVYSMLETGYSFPQLPGLRLNLNLGFDAGRLYNNYGVMVGLKYSGDLKKNQITN